MKNIASVAHKPLLYSPYASIIILYPNTGRAEMITKDLGNRIKELRKKTGLSQEKFALKIEMDRTYY